MSDVPSAWGCVVTVSARRIPLSFMLLVVLVAPAASAAAPQVHAYDPAPVGTTSLVTVASAVTRTDDRAPVSVRMFGGSGRFLLAAEGGGDLFAFGNASGPTGARLGDFGITSPDDIVGPFSPSAATDDVAGESGGNFAGGEIYIAPDGVGAVFSPSGVFQYFGRFPY